MGWWDERAFNLQRSVDQSERQNAIVNVFDDDEVRRSTVFARQDIVMICSQLSSLNKQVHTIKWLLGGIIAVGIANLFL